MKLALLLLAALAAPAFAERDPACPCETRRVVPAANTVDVPTNALFWHLPSDTPGRLIKPYELATHSDFVVEGIPFTTGSGPDHEPPIKPSIAGASITLAGDVQGPRLPLSLLHITAATSADTAVVHLHFIASHADVDYYTTPDQLSVCQPRFSLPPGHLRLEVTALDAAGNESEPDDLELDTTTDPRPSMVCHHHGALGNDVIDSPHRVDPAFVVFFAVLGCGLLVAYAKKCSYRRSQAGPVAFALPAVEQLAIGVRIRALAMIMIVGVATGLAVHDASIAQDAAAAAPLLVMLVVGAGTRYLDAGRVLRLLRFDGASATIQYDEAAVVVGKQRARVHASQGAIARARHHALPKATL